MAMRIEIETIVPDARGENRKDKLRNLGFNVNDVWLRDIYIIDKTFSVSETEKIKSSLCNPVTQMATIQDAIKRHPPKNRFSWAIEIGYLPGVTDNIAHTTKEIIEDLLKTKFINGEDVCTSQLMLIAGKISEKQIKDIALTFYNPLIHRVYIKSYVNYMTSVDIAIPKVVLENPRKVSEVDLNISDEELLSIGKIGIKDLTGNARGPLALDLMSMKSIQKYFQKIGRNPTDIEVESLAQTWSEHCKHTIFANPLDEIKDGLFKTYIKGATDKVRKEKGKEDFCVSVFTDNSGAIEFDKDFLITHKVETHNSPSALDPFGGAVTGIGGVIRDVIGFGLGAKPVANFYGFCLADPRKNNELYRGINKTQKMLSSRRIMDGVIEGVNAGGNQSGIPTPQGFIYFDEKYRGKPLVFVGTVGLIPRKINNKKSWIKKAIRGDYIVIVGGRVGKDGIHGATFSSEPMDSMSPATSVQIGDPITQKKLSDVLIKEIRDLLLYNSITDNGAGGLSCSVAEMAKESGGALVHLEKVPLKYPGLEPWEIWISESQERMTLSVPKNKWKKISKMFQKRGVEATIIGEFTNSGKCIVKLNKKTIMDIDMDFLHNGLPQRQMKSKPTVMKRSISSKIATSQAPRNDMNNILLQMLSKLNITSYSFITQQYDHIVQAGLVLSPLQGHGRVNSDATIFRPVLTSEKGVVLSQGLYPSFSEIDSYKMACASIDTAIRNAVAVGADPERLALLDNFCWCSSTDPERLYQLKEAAKACFKMAVSYGTPYISGKDSMFNDFKGYDENGKPIQISIPPTLLISSIGVIRDVINSVSLDTKIPGDYIYILGKTNEELGGSEYSLMHGFSGGIVPKVDATKNKMLYKALYNAIQKRLIASSISVTRGGLVTSLAKISIAGKLGLSVSLKNLPGECNNDDLAMYSESQGRIIVTVDPQKKRQFEECMSGNEFALIGEVTKTQDFLVNGLSGKSCINAKVEDLNIAYKKTFKGY